MNINICYNIICEFKRGDEYKKLKAEYDSINSLIDNQTLIDCINSLELLLKEKNKEDIYAAYVEGTITQILPSNESILHKGVDEIISYEKLNQSSTYAGLTNKIKETKSALDNKFKTEELNSSEQELIDKLFEIYSYVNYELIRCAYCYGYMCNLKEHLFTNQSEFILKVKNAIGAKLLYCRKTLGITQKEFSGILQIDRSGYALYELGKAIPPVIQLIRICKIFSISLEHLIDNNYSIKEFKTQYPQSHFQNYKNKSSQSVMADCPM